MTNNKKLNLFINIPSSNHYKWTNITNDKLCNNENNIDNYIKKHINKCEKGYDKRNKEKCSNNKNNKVIISFIYYFENKNNITVKYNTHYKYKLNIKTTVKKSFADKIIKIITDKSNKNERFSNIIEDNNMKVFYDNKIDNNEDVTIYFLKIYDTNETIKLFNDGFKIKINELFIENTQEYYNAIINNIDNVNICLQNLNIMLKIYKEYVKVISENEKWIKSIGEFYILCSLICLLRSKITINTSQINNPQTNRKLELDFYINEHFLAIEVDGKHHNNDDKQIYNDKIKNIILDTCDIKLIRIDTDRTTNDLSIYNTFYDNLKEIFNNKEIDILDKNNYIKIISIIKDKVSFQTHLHYELEYSGILNANDVNIDNIDNKTKQLIKEQNIINDFIKKFK